MLWMLCGKTARSDRSPAPAKDIYFVTAAFGYYFLKIMLPEMIFTTVVTLFIYRLLLAVNNAVRNFSPELPHIFGGFRKNH